ncbi:MAG: sensor histidine kinase [Rhodanobacteraceae bacterium]
MESESQVSTVSRVENDLAVRGRADAPERGRDADFGELTHAVLNALNAIAAASELAKLLLARGAAGDATKSLARIEPECLRAARLLREGRAFLGYRIEPGKGSVDVAGLVGSCAEAFEGRVEVVTDPGLPMIRGDAEALCRLFNEMLGNAFGFGADRVRVAVCCEEGGDELSIGFQDDGPGVAVSAARAFTPFFSTQPEAHTGLGLALAARIAQAHGGRVGLSESERGASFLVRLPVGPA